MLATYRYLIIGMAVMFSASGYYYINQAGGADIIIGAISGDKKINTMPLNVENVVGVYACDVNSGCNGDYILLLKNDKSAEMLHTLFTEDIKDKNNNSILIDTKIQKYSSDISTTDEEGVSNNDTQNNVTSSQDDSSKLSSLNSLSELSNSDSGDNILDKGDWDMGVQNMLIINFKENNNDAYKIPQKVVIKQVDGNILSKISYTKTTYKDMLKPVFVRQN